jgi:hypothetical protein
MRCLMKRVGMFVAVFSLLLSLVAFAWAGGDSSNKKNVAVDEPTALKLMIVKNAFQLSWKPSPQDPEIVNGYEIYRSTNLASGPFVKVGAVGKSVLQYTDNKAAPENIYYYKVRAVADRAKSPYSNTVTGER